MTFPRLMAIATLVCVVLALVPVAHAAEPPPPPPPPAATDAAPPPPPPAEAAAPAAPAAPEAAPPAAPAPAPEAAPAGTGTGSGSSISARLNAGPQLPPPVQASVKGDQLVISFPAGTIHSSVSFKVHGTSVTRQRIEDNPRAFRWTSDTELTADLNRLHGGGSRHHGKHHRHNREASDWHHPREGQNTSTLWVWGQLKTGEALLQQVNLGQ